MASVLELTQLPSQARESGITPDEQLKYLAFSQLERKLGLADEPLPFSLDAFFESAIHSILARSGFPVIGSEPDQNPSLFNRSVELLVPASPLPLAETNWYTALKRIDALPVRIPPLPENIHEILEGVCPIYKDQTKPDGTPYKIKDTQSLYLIPAGTLKELETRVSAYGEAHFQGKHPLKFRYFFDAAPQENAIAQYRSPEWTVLSNQKHANVPVHESQWVFLSNDALPGSLNQTYAIQVQMVDALSKKSFTDYQVPTLREAAVAIFLHKVATGESLYPTGNKLKSIDYKYTRVKETFESGQLVVGGFAPTGLHVEQNSGFDPKYGGIGVAVLRKL